LSGCVVGSGKPGAGRKVEWVLKHVDGGHDCHISKGDEVAGLVNGFWETFASLNAGK